MVLEGLIRGGGFVLGSAADLSGNGKLATSCVAFYTVWRLEGGSTGMSAIDDSLDYFAVGVGSASIAGSGKRKPGRLLWEAMKRN